MDFQAIFDGLSATMMRERAESQMTLGALIERLSELPSDTPIGLDDQRSYRGYYSDLAFEPSVPRPAGDVLADCRESMGKSFNGYKGGEYQMHDGTPMWVAFWGSCGKKLMAINDDGTLNLEDDD